MKIRHKLLDRDNLTNKGCRWATNPNKALIHIGFRCVKDTKLPFP